MTNKYVTENELQDAMRMAQARVYHYQQIGWTMFSKTDLLSAAYEGIAEALIRFEPAKGTVKETKFTSYAYFWIEKYLKEFITKNKTMLTGSSAELWTGEVPYTMSIDVYDSDDRDGIGSDHKDWLGTDVLASSYIEATEHANQIHELLATMFLELEPMQRLVIQLSIGIGTVAREPLTLREIARSTHLTLKVVEELLQQAHAKMEQIRPKYEKQFADIY